MEKPQLIWGQCPLFTFCHCYSKTALHSKTVKHLVICPCLFTTLLTRVVEVVCAFACVFNCLTVLGNV